MHKNSIPFIFGIGIYLTLSFSACKESGNSLPSPVEQSVDVVVSGMMKAIESDPTNSEIWFQKAEYLYENEQYDQALYDINQALRIDSTKAEYYHLKADIQLDYYQSKESINTLNSLLDLQPDRIPTLLKLAEFQLILKQYEESIATVNEIIGKRPQSAEAFFMLGMNFRAMGDSEKAKSSFQRAIELDAELTDAWIIMGNILEEEGQENALQYYNSAVLSNPSSIEALHSKAFYLQNHGNIFGAIHLYKQISVQDPKYEDAYLNTGILYLSLDSLESAKEHFNILIGLNPANAFAYYYNGLAQEAAGNKDDAAENYSTALRLAPNYQKAKQALEKLNL